MENYLNIFINYFTRTKQTLDQQISKKIQKYNKTIMKTKYSKIKQNDENKN